MILPDNGKVVIIDDEPKDVERLMVALTKEKMPFLFFKDRGGEDLPDNGPIDNIRLVFLDLDLGMGNGTSNEMEKIRVVQGRMERIIKPGTPYVLVIWSTHEDRLSNTLLTDFENRFSAYKPIANCSLDKTEVLSLPNSKIVPAIREKLKSALNPFESFNAFLLWESITNNSVGHVTNQLTSVFRKENWDVDIKNMFYKIAFANLNSEVISDYSDKERLKIAIKTINSILVDSIENNIENEFEKLAVANVREGGTGLTKEAKIKLNTTTHIIKGENLKHFCPGNLYISPLGTKGTELISKIFKSSKQAAVTASNPKLLSLDITPSCDYSNKKQFTRILNGLIVESIFAKSDLQQGEFLYGECPIMDIEFSGFIVFDFRYLNSYNKADFEALFNAPPLYRLRTNLLLDIQAQLSNHINRPGIISIK